MEIVQNSHMDMKMDTKTVHGRGHGRRDADRIESISVHSPIISYVSVPSVSDKDVDIIRVPFLFLFLFLFVSMCMSKVVFMFMFIFILLFNCDAYFNRKVSAALTWIRTRTMYIFIRLHETWVYEHGQGH
jgi:hypothetical protein